MSQPKCALCLQIASAQRFLRDVPTEPFVALIHPRVQQPTVVWREHNVAPSIEHFTHALALLHDLAKSWNYPGYVLVYNTELGAHWSCRVEPQKCPSEVSLDVLGVFGSNVNIQEEFYSNSGEDCNE